MSNPYPKFKRVECQAYLEWVAKSPCIACDKEDRVQAHHPKGRGNLSGSSLRAPDSWAFPLCYNCHDEIHSGNAEFLDRQFEWAAKTATAFMDLLFEGLGNKSMKTLVKGIE